MSEAGLKYVPVLTSPAGLSLTSANWQEVGCNVASYYLDSLLLKPGYDLLKAETDLAHYVNCPGSVILNASRIKANKEGNITLVSPFDGSKICLSYSQLIELIIHLKPETVILPVNILSDFSQFWDNWPSEIMPYFAHQDIQTHPIQQAHGVYFCLEEPNEILFEKIKQAAHLPRYIQGPINWPLMQQLSALGLELIESDEPAKFGMQGMVYGEKGTIDLTDSHLSSMSFEVIDIHCKCPTCNAQFTQAYLHHLYLHTPLLCQRFLIQHNVYQMQKS